MRPPSGGPPSLGVRFMNFMVCFVIVGAMLIGFVALMQWATALPPTCPASRNRTGVRRVGRARPSTPSRCDDCRTQCSDRGALIQIGS